MAQVFGNSANMAGGTSGAVQTDFPTSVNNVFQNPPKAAMVIEGDFVPGVATVKAKPGVDYGEFPFPSINGSPPSVVIGGDTIVAFRDTPAIEAFVKFLATPAAAAAWATKGGFATGNQQHAGRASTRTRRRARPPSAIAKAKNVAFDMSDQQPASFGATVGQGEWGLFQDFLRNPTDVSGIQKKLESAASGGVQEGQVARVERVGHDRGGAARRGGSTAPRSGPGLRRYCTGTLFLLPAFVILLGVWIVYPTVYTIVRSFFGPVAASTTSSGSTTTRRSSRRRR